MKILGIETSCDDTGVSVLNVEKNGTFDILSNIVSSQVELHKKYGGVYPSLAKREHQKNLVPVLIKALRQSKLLESKSKKEKIETEILNKILEREPELEKKLIPFLQKYEKPNIDVIAVTNGPGLEPALWVGVNFAKALSFYWNVPIVEVNHIKAHIFVNMLGKNKIQELTKKDFPVVCLIVSGGHTQLFLMTASASAKASAGQVGKYKILGETRDDAAGECFDKCARILGLGYPGGPEIAKLAGKTPSSIQLPRPMLNTKDYDFSFSGLKTAVLYADKKVKNKDKQYKKTMATEIQQAIIDVLIKKTMKATKDFDAKSIVLGGGVTANKELRKQFQQAVFQRLNGVEPLNLLLPPTNLSTDNALMTALAGYFRAKQNKFKWSRRRNRRGSPMPTESISGQALEAKANLRIK